MKKIFKPFICIILGMLLMFFAIACQNNQDNDNQQSDDYTRPTNANKDTSSDINTTDENTDGNTPTTPVSSENPDTDKNPEESKILIVYFTAEYGNTERVANYIHSKVGGDIVKIEAAQPYTSQELNYSIKNNRPEVEKAQNARPEIAQATYDKIDMSKYDTVFIGYPIWWWTAPMIIGTFLEHYDLTGKEIYPFTQSASMNTEHFDTSMDFVHECASKNGSPVVHDGLFARATSTATVDSYLTENEFRG